MRNISIAGAPSHEGTPHFSVGNSGNSFIVGRDENSRERVEIISINGVPMDMHMNLSLAPLVALIAGILILVMPRLLNYIVAIYLIVTGLLGLFGGGGSGLHFH
jgi:hypothetical protein